MTAAQPNPEVREDDDLDGPPEGFPEELPAQLDEATAAELLSKLLAFDEREAMMKRQVETLKRRLEKERERWREYVEPLLRTYYDEHPPAKGKILHLATGSLGMRKQAGGLRLRSREKAIEWAREKAPALIDVEVIENIAAKDLEEHHKRTGEIPDGCDLVDDRETFYLRAPRG